MKEVKKTTPARPVMPRKQRAAQQPQPAVQPKPVEVPAEEAKELFEAVASDNSKKITLGEPEVVERVDTAAADLDQRFKEAKAAFEAEFNRRSEEHCKVLLATSNTAPGSVVSPTAATSAVNAMLEAAFAECGLQAPDITEEAVAIAAIAQFEYQLDQRPVVPPTEANSKRIGWFW